ncbi:hypothetical protein B0E38_04725 [Streptomyces sp. 111WW2]|uniref:hypothetical protein n=1 Tax=Streptomyces sp. 111WW2 TaxID=1945515 RepID=UPI000D0C79C1|nr:hypothetical protein [Streptomyces sp. 111WW2]PSK52399.1 hypothetical protein B0E38_04725 [Streptomyces sp. 111WW2]
MNTLIATGGIAAFFLLVASVVSYRMATAEPEPLVDSGECAGDDCRDCALLFRHPSQAPVRRALAERLPRQTRGEKGGAL